MLWEKKKKVKKEPEEEVEEEDKTKCNLCSKILTQKDEEDGDGITCLKCEKEQDGINSLSFSEILSFPDDKFIRTIENMWMWNEDESKADTLIQLRIAIKRGVRRTIR